MSKKTKLVFVKIHKKKKKLSEPGTTWTMQKTQDTGASAQFKGTGVSFGFPHYTQVIYPGKTARINTGWNLQDLPIGTMMHTVPHR